MRAQEIVERALTELPHAGFVVVEEHSAVNLRWANSTLTTNGEQFDQRVSVVAIVPAGQGSACGAASGSVDSVSAITALVRRAEQAARSAGAAEDAAPLASGPGADPLWDDPAALTSAAALRPVADHLGGVFPASSTGVEHFGYAEHSIATTWLGMSTGLRLRFTEPQARFELCGKSHGRTRSAWSGRAGRDFTTMDLAGTATEVAAGLSAHARRVEVSPGRHTAILSASAVADLMVYLYWSASARDAVDGRSALRGPDPAGRGGATAAGRRFSDLPITLSSDPHDAQMPCADHALTTASGSLASTYDTGLPLGLTRWIDDGVLANLVSTRHSAELAGLPVTPMIGNLALECATGAGDLAALAQRVGEGLLVTCLWYIREVDAKSLLLTGLTRDGVYVVRGGEVVGACGNFRFNESPLDALARTTDTGAPQRCLPREWADWFTRTRMAPLAVADFNFSTASDAV